MIKERDVEKLFEILKGIMRGTIADLNRLGREFDVPPITLLKYYIEALKESTEEENESL